MHSLCLVVGDSPEEQLEPFSQHLEVERYKSFLDGSDVARMAEHFSLPVTDLDALAEKLDDWTGCEGGVDEGRLFLWATENPRAVWDWYAIGGRFAGYLELEIPRSAGFWSRLFGRTSVSRVDQAKRREIREEPLLAEPPAAMLLDGDWHEGPMLFGRNEEKENQWRREFRELFLPIPEDTLLTVVDVHS